MPPAEYWAGEPEKRLEERKRKLKEGRKSRGVISQKRLQATACRGAKGSPMKPSIPAQTLTPKEKRMSKHIKATVTALALSIASAACGIDTEAVPETPPESSATAKAASEGRSSSGSTTVTPGNSGLGVGFAPEQFALIPAGTFQMGSTNGRPEERPVHTVNITQPFYMQKTEVTQRQWRQVMGTNPSRFSDCGDLCPVERVSWNDIQEFLTKLNAMYPGMNYRLPTEAEWEYAARAGTTGHYGGTGVLDQMGWYSGNSGRRTHPVAQRQPNHWGLFGMHGNVWEWMQDRYSSTYYQYCLDNEIVDDPQGPATGPSRVVRGGSWLGNASRARSAYRYGSPPNYRFSHNGFRLARTLSKPGPSASPLPDAPWVGTYVGQTPAYNLKSREGEDVVIMGQTVRIPRARWTLTLRPDRTARLLHAVPDEDVHSYSGTCTVKSTEEGFAVDCAFSIDPPYRDSSPRYSYTIDVEGLVAHCAPDASGQPAFTLLRQTSDA